jgi:Fur family ferric uptake transcriptional regulator
MRVAEQLNTVGLKATLPRLKVLQVFHSHERRHLSAEDVHRRMVEQSADVGLATVYRVLA